MRPLRALLVTALALLSAACDGPKITAEAGASATAAKSAAPPRPDDSPPAWLPPPEYSEIPWDKAVSLIRHGEVERAFATRTRRAYLVTSKAEKRFTIEPMHGDFRTVCKRAPNTDYLLDRDDVEEISWKEAEALIREGRVTEVGLSHFQIVGVSVKGRGYLFSIRPTDANVQGLVDELNAKGASIGVAVE